MVIMEKIEFERFITTTAAKSAQLGAQKALEMAGIVCPFLTMREAYRKYGKNRVARWIDRGIVKPLREGGNTSARVPVAELINAAIGEESIRFFENPRTNATPADKNK